MLCLKKLNVKAWNLYVLYCCGSDDQQFLVNNDCRVDVLLQYLRTKLHIPDAGGRGYRGIQF